MLNMPHNASDLKDTYSMLELFLLHVWMPTEPNMKLFFKTLTFSEREVETFWLDMTHTTALDRDVRFNTAVVLMSRHHFYVKTSHGHTPLKLR